MAMSRRRGARSVTSASPIEIAPSVTSSSPAIMRSSVDFPQPEGPTRTRNSPSAISSEMSSTATTPPREGLGDVLEADPGHARTIVQPTSEDDKTKVRRSG